MIDQKNVRKLSNLGTKTEIFDIGSVASTTAVREIYLACESVDILEMGLTATGMGSGTYSYGLKTDNVSSTPEADSGTARIASATGLSALRHTTTPAQPIKVDAAAGNTVNAKGLALKAWVTSAGGTPTRVQLRIRYRPYTGREA